MRVKFQKAFTIYRNEDFTYLNGTSGNLNLIVFGDYIRLLIGYINVPAHLNNWTPVVTMAINTQYNFYVDKDNTLSTNVDRNYIATRQVFQEATTVQIIASI